uniref:C3H1-type domain-containing protein n=1 Tax=Pyrodinium bahamense TaxID=73915 RepID=A0A7S0AKE1_9DINO|mmetsp:Transcript_3647/g.10009  ORF Transcript_3647/g.10009 Transcript_3647/m.10009 type:complete len:322 (+) Transcript_3647:64-1029(+)
MIGIFPPSTYAKTKLCRYYTAGQCRSGEACSFAHSPDELRPKPDLSCTKPCPSWALNLPCTVPDCKYAHSWNQLRPVVGLPDEFSSAAVPALPPGLGSDLGRPAGAIATASSPFPVLDLPLGLLVPPVLKDHRSEPLTISLVGLSGDPVKVEALATEGGEEPEAPGPGGDDAAAQAEGTRGQSHNMFFRTKMCNLFDKGICSKGAKCDFAHSKRELRPKPDLRKTKLCPGVLEAGICSNGIGCPFAHSASELRDREGVINEVKTSEDSKETSPRPETPPVQLSTVPGIWPGVPAGLEQYANKHPVELTMRGAGVQWYSERL